MLVKFKANFDQQSVEDMYVLADEIVGELKTIDDATRVQCDNISDT